MYLAHGIFLAAEHDQARLEHAVGLRITMFAGHIQVVIWNLEGGTAVRFCTSADVGGAVQHRCTPCIQMTLRAAGHAANRTTGEMYASRTSVSKQVRALAICLLE